MTRHSLKLVAGISLIAVCGSVVSAQDVRADVAEKSGTKAPATATVDQFPALPAPIMNPATAARHSGPVSLKRMDLKTGQVTEIPLSSAGDSIPEAMQSLLNGGNTEQILSQLQETLNNPEGSATSGSQGVAEFGGEIILNRNFGSRTLVTAVSSYPNSYNCRITGQYGSAGYSGTAALVDPRWVMTAGHCVYSARAFPATVPANTWASNFTVMPGYDNGVNANFGAARGIALWTYTGWTNSTDFQYDLAFVELDRPVGALTGWAGFGFNTASSFFTNNIFLTKGYPGQSGYNGQRMYARAGNFSSRFGNIAYSYPGSIPGESGSSSTLNNISYGVMSHVTNSGYGGTVALWSSAFYDLRDARILAHTPVGADLIPLAVRTPTTSKNRGGVIPYVQVLIHNYSRSTFYGTPIISMRTSSNDLISTFDPQGSVHSAGYMSIAPKASRWVTLYNVVVSPSSPTGTIWLGAIINNADANTGNNATMAADTDRVYVY